MSDDKFEIVLRDHPPHVVDAAVSEVRDGHLLFWIGSHLVEAHAPGSWISVSLLRKEAKP